jgi:adenosylmethionine-8-amino-7-oxononanoate aminotransferase
MEEALQRHAHETAAVILEPLVQCAGGMRMYHPVYLRLLREACSRHQVHLIADEIAVGFGRSGRMFAWEWAYPPSKGPGNGADGSDRTSPDFLCLSKGITGGTLPLAAVLTNDQVYEAFYDDYASHKAFLHSHSYTGNPLACTAALATLELFEASDVLAANRRSSQLMWAAMSSLSSHRHVADLRQQGMILAVEMAKNPHKREPFPPQERRGLRVYRHGLEQGVLLRPLGNVIYLMPPYVISAEEIMRMCSVAIEGIELAARDG